MLCCTTALPRQRMVAISLPVLANSSDKCISFIRISYLATPVNSCIGLQWTKKQPTPITSEHAVVDYAVSLLWYYRVLQYRVSESFSGIALHDTMLYYFSILLPLSSTCLHGYGVIMVNHLWKVLFIYPLINLSSKKITHSIYNTNLTLLDYECNWIRGLINRYEEVFCVG